MSYDQRKIYVGRIKEVNELYHIVRSSSDEVDDHFRKLNAQILVRETRLVEWDELRKNRFHREHAELKPQVTNKFGYNFEAFVEVSNDPGMKQWCAGYVKNQSDPAFMQQQREKKAVKARKFGKN
ncbi:hypothetical protein CAEBREN_02597 [Caenorhabditis brenneri]|uniref:Uncharacterized protein n=1 Tax=Caenorhabditis brenneri TaxID=135651 RepID=G0NX49_CAEBE|nr:hypothetical protein CAEBREN_02597 [Caenorhabditis brenneri]